MAYFPDDHLWPYNEIISDLKVYTRSLMYWNKKKLNITLKWLNITLMLSCADNMFDISDVYPVIP